MRLAAFLCALVLPLAGGFPVVAAPEAPAPVAVEAVSVPYSHRNPEETGNGRLIFRGGLKLKSDDPRFGGLSGLDISADGTRLLAVTDEGRWLSARLTYADGRLSGLSDARMGPLLGLDGAPLTGNKIEGDSEGLVRLDDFGFPGDVAISFERHHRVWRYRLTEDGLTGLPRPIAMRADLRGAQTNKGIEALAVLPETHALIAITEGTFDDKGNNIGWLVTADSTRLLRLRHDAPYLLTDLATLPSGDLLTLERRYSMLGGVGAQMRLIPKEALDRAEPLDGDVIFSAGGSGNSIDNMEGLAIRNGKDGATYVYAVSDNNFSGLQRTLLLMFELTP